MKNVNFDVYEYIINLVKQGYDVDSISRTLNLEKSYVVSMLRRIRSDIVSSMDEESFYLITMIDVLLKKKVKNVTRNFGGTKRNQIFDMLCDGQSYMEIVSLLNISLSVYLSLLKAMYIDLYNYGSEEEKIYLNLVRNSIDEVLVALRYENTVVKVRNDKIPRKQLMVQKGLNNERVLSHSYVSDSSILDVSDNFKFIVISDTHFGSKYENFDYLKEVYDYALSHGIKYIFHAGDLIEGSYANYRRCKRKYMNVEAQVNHVIEEYPYDESIINVMLLGNHDAFPIVINGFDISDSLHERKDFVVTGYRSSYMKAKEEYISLKHEISRLLNEVEDSTVLLNFFGHSHQYKCFFDGKYAIFRVPTLADLPSNAYTIVNRGFLVGNIDFEGCRAANLSIDYINFDDKNTISFERKLIK